MSMRACKLPSLRVLRTLKLGRMGTYEFRSGMEHGIRAWRIAFLSQKKAREDGYLSTKHIRLVFG